MSVVRMVMNSNSNSKTTENTVRRWMRAHLLNPDGFDEPFDDTTGEPIATKLAENAAQKFELCEADDEATIPEWVFDVAAEITDEYERAQG
jgi:hypothetical protein